MIPPYSFSFMGGFWLSTIKTQMAGAFLHDFAGFLYFSVFTKKTLSAMCKMSVSLQNALTTN